MIDTLVVYGHGISIFGLDYLFWISGDGYGFVGVCLTGLMGFLVWVSVCEGRWFSSMNE